MNGRFYRQGDQVDFEPLVSTPDCIDLWRRLNCSRGSLRPFEEALYSTISKRIEFAAGCVAIQVREEDEVPF